MGAKPGVHLQDAYWLGHRQVCMAMAMPACIVLAFKAGRAVVMTVIWCTTLSSLAVNPIMISMNQLVKINLTKLIQYAMELEMHTQ